MSDPVTEFIEASVRMAGIGDPSGVNAAEAGAKDHVARVRTAIALPLPRTEKRLRVPLEVAGQMLTGIGDGPWPYDRYLLPPAVQALSAAELTEPQVVSQAEKVMKAWRDVVGELAAGAALTSILATIDEDRWMTIVDPGDFPMAAESPSDPAWASGTHPRERHLPRCRLASRLVIACPCCWASGRAQVGLRKCRLTG